MIRKNKNRPRVKKELKCRAKEKIKKKDKTNTVLKRERKEKKRKKGKIDYCEILRKGQTKKVEKQEIIRANAFHGVINSRHHNYVKSGDFNRCML